MSLSHAERITRALLGASVSTFVALGSHILGGGDLPALAGVLVPWGLSVAVCLQFAGRALSLWRLAIAVGVSQALFHSLFVVGSGGAQMSASGHAHHGGHLEVATTAASTHGAHGGLAMTAAHVAAAVVTTAALHHAEWLLTRATRGIAWLCAHLLPAAPASTPLTVAAVRTVTRASAFPAILDAACGVRSLRGPPALSA
ncbi:hypothetical protein [Demequina sp.]|uniref:hypothetical protein n=1 Tax=Demequina sp. TaxID=2050685 RepID=UPI003A89B6C4